LNKLQQAHFETLKNKTTFYFVRHGQSAGNKDGKIQGRQDSPLTNAGREQARKTGRWLASRSIDRIYTSPLSRSRETAEIFSTEGKNLPVQPLDELLELDTGIFSGMSFKEIAVRHPEIYRSFQTRSWEVVPRAENAASICRRVLNCWQLLIEDANRGCRNILCVSHGGTIQWFLKTSFPMSGCEWMPLFTAGNCSVFQLTVEPAEAADSAEPEGSDRPDAALQRIAGSGSSFYAIWERINYIP
jgi:broad specificity phosphatase PhoE